MNTIELKVEQYTNDDGQLVYEAYFMNDTWHNPNGPAYREWDAKGQLILEEYWLHGKELTKEQFLLQLNSCSGRIVTIDGKKYRLEEI